MFPSKIDGDKIRYAVVGAGWISHAAFMPGVEQMANPVMTSIIVDDGIVVRL